MQDLQSLEIINGEKHRQETEMELIASENYVSKDVREALWCLLTNKYAEGYPWKRYYAGQQYTDMAESLAIERAKTLFKAEFANVQTLSWAPANFATYLALLEPWQKILWMWLADWWHLTHGAKVNASSKVWQSVSYWLNLEKWEIDYDALLETAKRERPNLIVAWFSAYPKQLNYKRFKEIANEVWALLMADIAHIAWFVATWLFENPLDFWFDVVTSTTHKTLRGPRWWLILTNNPEIAKKIDSAVFPWFQWGPHMNNILAKAVCFYEALQPSFKEYAKQVLLNAQAFSDELKKLWATIVTWWTTNHIILVDVLSSFNIWWKLGQDALEKAWLSTNRNWIPWDTRKPFDPSWIRFWTPAMTTRWFKEEEFREVARIVKLVLSDPNNESLLKSTKEKVEEMCKWYLVP